MFHPAIVKYCTIRFYKPNTYDMKNAVTYLKKSLEKGQTDYLDWVNWEAMSEATGLPHENFSDVYWSGSWSDQSFRQEIEKIVNFSPSPKALEEYL